MKHLNTYLEHTCAMEFPVSLQQINWPVDEPATTGQSHEEPRVHDVGISTDESLHLVRIQATQELPHGPLTWCIEAEVFLPLGLVA